MAPPDDAPPSPSATPAPAALHATTPNPTPDTTPIEPTNINTNNTNININHAATTTVNTTNINTIRSNTQPSTGHRQQAQQNACEPHSHAQPTGQSENRRRPPSDEEVVFDVPDISLARQANAEAYKAHVLLLHAKMAGGNADDYVETKIVLPRSLQGLRTGQVMTRLLALNPNLNAAMWSDVMADVVGNSLIMGTVCAGGKEMIDKLSEIKVEPGRTVRVPPATKPNNRYYVECLLPHERELHVAFLEAFLKKFPTAKQISMPGKKAFGTTRRIRLYFTSTSAPRDVLTAEDANMPIREIVLPCGSAAQIIHKWQRLNQVRPPHLLNRWAHDAPPRTYMAAATGATSGANTTMPSRSYAQATANTQHGAQVTRGPIPPPTNHTTAIPHPHHPLVQRPETAPHGPPSQIDQLREQPNHAQQPTPMEDWTADEPFPPSAHTDNTPTEREANAPTKKLTPPTTGTTTTSLIPSPPPPSKQAPVQDSGLTQKTTAGNCKPQAAQHATATTPLAIGDTTTKEPGSAQPTPNTASPPTDPRLTTLPQTNTADVTPTRSPSETVQWQLPKRQRTRRSQTHPSATTEPQPQPQRSSSRSRKPKVTNKFAPLDFIIHPTFTDDDTAPFEVTLPTKPPRPPRKKYRDTRKALTSEVCDAFSHPREVRHPAQTLTHLSPPQLQVVIRSADDKAKHGRLRLARQIALLRAARNNSTERNILLEQHADETFINQVRTRLAECTDPPDCPDSAPIDLLLSAILDRDELRVRGAMCFAWMDLITRAALPHLYDQWPDPPPWNGLTLHWLQGSDKEVPCLRDESLAALAACPSLTNVWQHMSTRSAETAQAISTAANQWRMFVNAQKRNQ